MPKHSKDADEQAAESKGVEITVYPGVPLVEIYPVDGGDARRGRYRFVRES